MHPSRQPSSQPSRHPSRHPSSQPTRQPTRRPSSKPTSKPSLKAGHTYHPTSQPTTKPTHPSGQPTRQPIGHPTGDPPLLSTPLVFHDSLLLYFSFSSRRFDSASYHQCMSFFPLFPLKFPTHRIHIIFPSSSFCDHFEHRFSRYRSFHLISLYPHINKYHSLTFLPPIKKILTIYLFR